MEMKDFKAIISVRETRRDEDHRMPVTKMVCGLCLAACCAHPVRSGIHVGMYR